MKSRLKLLLIGLTVVNISFFALATGASAATTDATAAAKATAEVAAASSAEQKQLTTLKTRADAEITRRITTLNKLATVINGASKLTADDKTTLTNQVNSSITSLKQLQAKIDAETSLTTALSDAATIVTEYRVYLLVVPKVYLVRAADDQVAVEAKLTTVATKLQTRLNAAKSAGKDVTALQAVLTDMNAKIAVAQAISPVIEQKVVALLPADYNANPSLLVGYKTQLQTAHTANVAALADAKTIVAGLKNL